MSTSTKILLTGFGNSGDYNSVLTTCKCCLHMLVFQPVTTLAVYTEGNMQILVQSRLSCSAFLMSWPIVCSQSGAS